MTTKPATLGELRKLPGYETGTARRTVKDELRANILQKLETGEPLFPGIHGYEETVLPQIANALLARHNFILLGLRGQAKSRILRGLIDFLDQEIPYITGCEIHDDPLAPLCRACRDLVAEKGEATPISWLPRDQRCRAEAGPRSGSAR
jgi:magnesium chelatase subunit I